MRKPKLLANETDEALIALFTEFALRSYRAQDEAEHENQADVRRINREILRGRDVGEELKRRGLESRLKLMALYDHPNVQVKLNAATATLAVAPVEARQMIEAIAGWRHFPQSGEAGMRLSALDRGIFKPT